jgi:hypothetical protein
MAAGPPDSFPGFVADDGLKALEGELRATVPAGLRAVGDEQLADLADAVRDARHRQAEALKDAGDQALGHIPRLLRGPIRKALS